MIMSRSYRIAFGAAICLHLLIVAYFSFEKTNQRPVLTVEAKNEPGQSHPSDQPQVQPQPIQAVSVDSKEIMSAVSQLKAERTHQKQQEESRQRALKQQAEQARKQQIEAQQQVAKLKSEAAALAVARQKHLAEEQEHLKQLALKKQEQEKMIAEMKKQHDEMKKQQEQETKKLAELAKKKATELAAANAATQEKINKEKAEQAKQQLARETQEKAEKARAAWIQKQQAAAQQAAADAANAARVAGEVDKYKALILNAISQQWILPQNVDSSMSSQFRIRLAPNGAVLEVALIRSSGDPILDRSAQSAIYKASPLPVPNDPSTFNLFRDISLTVRPVNGRG